MGLERGSHYSKHISLADIPCGWSRTRLAIDFLTIPGEYYSNMLCSIDHTNLSHLTGTIDVECLFTRGRRILSHTRSWLTVTSTSARLCLGSWSFLSLIRSSDLDEVGIPLPEDV
jgi:hypothetical protein